MALHSDCFTHQASHVRIIVHATLIGMLGLLLLTEVFEWIYMVDHHDMAKLAYQDTWFYTAVLFVVILAWLLAFYVSKKQDKQDYLSMHCQCTGQSSVCKSSVYKVNGLPAARIGWSICT